MRLAAGVDNLTCVAWLDGALEQAFKQRNPELWAYLEAVMEEVLFEMEAQLLDRTRVAKTPTHAVRSRA